MSTQNHSIQQELVSVEHGESWKDFYSISLRHSVKGLRLGESGWPTGRSFGSPLTSAPTGVLAPTSQAI